MRRCSPESRHICPRASPAPARAQPRARLRSAVQSRRGLPRPPPPAGLRRPAGRRAWAAPLPFGRVPLCKTHARKRFPFRRLTRFAEAVAAALRRFAARSRRPAARGGSSIRTAPPCRIPQAPEQTLKDQITRYFPPCPSGPAVGFFMLKSSRRMSWTATSGACAAVLQ